MGNVHFCIGPVSDKKVVNQLVYGPIEKFGGAVSAEHGIGLDKKAYLSLSRTPTEIDLMRTLKRALDPKGILNPNKVFELDPGSFA